MHMVYDMVYLMERLPLYICISGEEEWRAEQRDGSEILLQWSAETQDISVISDTYFPIYFIAPGK